MTETLTDATRLRSLRAAFALVPLLLAGLSGMLVPEPWTARPPRDIPQSTADEALQHTVIRRGPPAAYALAA